MTNLNGREDRPGAEVHEGDAHLVHCPEDAVVQDALDDGQVELARLVNYPSEHLVGVDVPARVPHDVEHLLQPHDALAVARLPLERERVVEVLGEEVVETGRGDFDDGAVVGAFVADEVLLWLVMTVVADGQRRRRQEVLGLERGDGVEDGDFVAFASQPFSQGPMI